jgi:hypothetical protein
MVKTKCLADRQTLQAGGLRPQIQWQAQPPPQQCPPPPDFPAGALSAAPAAAKVENFLSSFAEPQCGHLVPFQFDERTRISLSRPHFSQ